MAEQKYRNSVTLFLPFIDDEENSFDKIRKKITLSNEWQLCKDKIRYMHRYITEKFDTSDQNTCQCFHYKLDNQFREKYNILPADALYVAIEWPKASDPPFFGFYLEDIDIFCFSTEVNIMALRLRFTEQDSYRIAAAEYCVKKVANTSILPADGESKNGSITLQRMAENITKTLTDSADFFFFANRKSGRANILTYLEVPKKDNYTEELYFMKHAYGSGFHYYETQKAIELENFALTDDVTWGITTEAVVCLVCPERGRKDFLENVFYNNFHNEYFFMYTLLLHQKYMLYKLLTKIGRGSLNTHETLVAYRDELYEFETDFVFSHITEVPQYQLLYSRIVEVFALRAMYEDVHEPLVSLREVRSDEERRAREEEQRAREEERIAREEEQRQQEAHNARFESTLGLLSILGIFSALVDSFDFAGEFFAWCRGEQSSAIPVFRVLFLVVVVIISCFVLWNVVPHLIRNFKKNRQIKKDRENSRDGE